MPLFDAYVEEDFYMDMLDNIEDLLTNWDGVGEDTSFSMSLEDIAEQVEEDVEEVRKALYYLKDGELDDRFHFENGLYSRC